MDYWSVILSPPIRIIRPRMIPKSFYRERIDSILTAQQTTTPNHNTKLIGVLQNLFQHNINAFHIETRFTITTYNSSTFCNS